MRGNIAQMMQQAQKMQDNLKRVQDELAVLEVTGQSGGGMVSILYDDGTTETRPANQVKEYSWHVGSKVECRWKGGSDWYGGTIASMSSDGVTMNVLYDDGDREQTKTGKCRSR